MAAVRGNPTDLGGYYHANDDKVGGVMRSSATLNSIIG
jgi:isocitrate dehydrogenase